MDDSLLTNDWWTPLDRPDSRASVADASPFMLSFARLQPSTYSGATNAPRNPKHEGHHCPNSRPPEPPSYRWVGNVSGYSGLEAQRDRCEDQSAAADPGLCVPSPHGISLGMTRGPLEPSIPSKRPLKSGLYF